MKITKKRLQEIILEELKEADMIDEIGSYGSAPRPRQGRRQTSIPQAADASTSTEEEDTTSQSGSEQAAAARSSGAQAALRGLTGGGSASAKQVSQDLGKARLDVAKLGGNIPTDVRTHLARLKKALAAHTGE